MSYFTRKMMKIVGYLSHKNVALFLTYFYIFTFIVLIGIYTETTHIDKLTEQGTRYIKEPEVKSAILENGGKNGVLQNGVVIKETVIKSAILENGGKNGVLQNGFDSKESKMATMNKKDKENDNMVLREIQPDSKPEKKVMHDSPSNIGKNNRRLQANSEGKSAQSNTASISKYPKTSPKYASVEMVQNFKFNTTPTVKADVWQNILADGTFLIFSAFLEHTSGQPYVRGLAMNGNLYMPRFYCEMTYTDDVIETVKGLKPWMLPDHHEKQYKTLFLYCPLPDDRVPKYISIIPVKEPVRLQRLPVIYEPKEERNFTVCLSPLFFNYSVEHELVQWFEVNKLIGADMFIVYNYSTVGRTDEILNHYVREGWVKVIQWQLPVHTDLHYYGQISMMNDCFLRNYKVSRYMVNIDLDELIIPRKGMTSWGDLMTSLPHDQCEYSFRSTIMAAESKNVFEGKQKARELNINFLLTTARREYIFDRNVRSKYIVNTTCVDTVGIHFCWKYRNGTADTQRYHVPPRDGLMYHFRSEPVAKKGREIEEKSVYKYHTLLIQNVKQRWDKINSEKEKKKSKI